MIHAAVYCWKNSSARTERMYTAVALVLASQAQQSCDKPSLGNTLSSSNKRHSYCCCRIQPIDLSAGLQLADQREGYNRVHVFDINREATTRWSELLPLSG